MENHTDKVVPSMTDYHISPVSGFMIEDPLEYLPEYFQIWNELGRNVDRYLSEHTLRDEVHQMPQLDHNKLKGHRQKRLAFMFLSFMGNGYIWQEGDAGMAKSVPSQLAIPWASVAKDLRLPLCLCHACCMLSNWIKIDPDRNMRGICHLPSKDRQSEWFFLVTAIVELAGIPAIMALERSLHAVVTKDDETIKQQLNIVFESIQESKVAMKRMAEKLEPYVFYNQMRPFLSGWGGSSTPQAEEGVIFEGVFDDKPQMVIGGSAAQSSYIQCLDAGLGIVHEPEKQKFLDLMRDYMVPAHADYIRAIWVGPSLRNYVSEAGSPELSALYNKCVEAVAAFRSFHIQMVTRYIAVPLSQQNRNTEFESVSERGTGGQDLIPFLKNIRETTNNHELISK